MKFPLEKKIHKILAGVSAAILAFALLFYFLVIKDLPDINEIEHYRPSLTTKIYTYDNQFFASFAAEKRTLVAYNIIPKHLIQAVVAVEDARFYKHKGLDWQSITRAFWENLRAAKYAQGASTITQQLARALFLNSKKTLRRKAQEALLALEIDKNYSKDEIITLYLNQVYLGCGAYGVETASNIYFDKPVSELNLAEAAFIAGLPRAPSFYNPYVNLEAVESRRRHVLKRMLDEHYIDHEQYQQAVETKLEFREPLNNDPAPYFIEHIRRNLEAKYGSGAIYHDGLHIYTTLDLDFQLAAEKAMQKGLEELDKRQGFRPIKNEEELPAEYRKIKEGAALKIGQKVLATVESVQPTQLWIKAAGNKGYIEERDFAWANKKDFVPGQKILAKVLKTPKDNDTDYKFMLDQYPLVQGALIAIDPRDGSIKAMVGGYSSSSKFNRAVQARRQPGSAFKPIIYAAGLLNDFNPASILIDAPIIYQEGDKENEWKPGNSYGKFVGPTTIRDALENSRNIITIKILRKIGVKNAINMARNLGITSRLDNDLSLALGSSCLSLIELTNSYGAFANKGMIYQPYAINTVLDNNLTPLEKNSPIGKQVLDEKTSYLMARLLQGVVEHGTGWKARSLGRPVAGKTGTTNNYMDTWFVGFVPQLTVGVWVGFDDPKSLGRLETGSSLASPIWVDFMAAAIKKMPSRDFEEPPGVVQLSIDAKSGMLATDECEHVIREYFNEQNVPTAVCDQHGPQVQRFMEMDLAEGVENAPAKPDNKNEPVDDAGFD